ncbi:hypothetical protein HY745_14090 [Candidatus Desantisbacteria bacterium]|nr:hypothetical protein [Candidatus Desantisbacteria bacterium]
MTITIATWNLENFQHPDDSSNNKRGKIYAKKLDYIENILIQKLKLPDIIGFQEILGTTQISDAMEVGVGPQREIPKCLFDIEKRLKAHAPYTFHFSNYRSRGIRIALFTKLPVKMKEDGTADIIIYDQLGPESHISLPWIELCPSDPLLIRVYEFGDSKAWYENRGKFTRPPMCVRISKGDINLQVFIAHLKSKAPRYDFMQPYPNINGTNRTRHNNAQDPVEEARAKMRSLMIRAREACQLRYFIQERMAEYPKDNAIIMGDLSDDINAVTTQMLESTDYQSTPKTNRTQNTSMGKFFNLTSLIKPEKRFSHFYGNLKEQHDHILISENLKQKLSNINSTSTDSQIFVFNEDIQKKSVVPEGYEYIPDHAPLVAQIEI